VITIRGACNEHSHMPEKLGCIEGLLVSLL